MLAQSTTGILVDPRYQGLCKSSKQITVPVIWEFLEWLACHTGVMILLFFKNDTRLESAVVSFESVY